MKIRIDELNQAYQKVNEIKNSGEHIKGVIEVNLDRNPLIDSDFFDDTVDYVMPFKLTFIWDARLGTEGHYILETEVEVIGDDNELIEE